MLRYQLLLFVLKENIEYHSSTPSRNFCVYVVEFHFVYKLLVFLSTGSRWEANEDNKYVDE